MIVGGALYPATMRESRLPGAQSTVEDTDGWRSENINAAFPVPLPPLYKRHLPHSQDSIVSVASSTFSAPQLPSSSSNLSTSTAGESGFTSPASSGVLSGHKQPVEQVVPPSPTGAPGRDALLRIDPVNVPPGGDTAASPMSVESPVAQGFKRTADGSVKGAALTIDSSVGPSMGHKRNKSMESNPNPRIGELSAQLKTRLSYAMVKVQNGWEKQSLEELEEQTSQRGSPILLSNRGDGTRLTFDSPTVAERRRRPSGVSDNSDQMLISPGQSTPSDASRSLATTPSSFWRPGTKPAMNASVNLISVTGSDASAMLGSAANVGSRRKRRSSASHHPPPMLASNQRKHYSDLSGTPRTPATPRAGILRMPSQQAEKDAVDTLLFMSSPNNSGRLSHTSTDAQAQKINAPARRVMFENHPADEKGTSHVPQVQAPKNKSAAYYYDHPSR